jgi:hypothetical protein
MMLALRAYAPACLSLGREKLHRHADQLGQVLGGEKQESHWARHASGSLTSCLMRVDWPAQPYLKPAQTI